MKKITAVCLVLILLSFVAGCAKRELTFEIGEASKIKIFSGSIGKSVEITDADTIARITDDINDHKFTKDKSSKNYEGFAYEIIWYDADGAEMEVILLMNGQRISYDDYFYDKESCDCTLDIDYIESFFAE